jgi:hypothetical protein
MDRAVHRRLRPEIPSNLPGYTRAVTSVVFSGHMIDKPDRDQPRFSEGHVPCVDDAIRAAVAEVPDPDAQGFSGAACGGDLLFCRAWLATGRRLTIFLPRDLEPFLDESVRFGGPEWENLFRRVISAASTTVIAPEPGMGELDDPHTPNNLRMLAAALDDPPVTGIFVWDGHGGDGPGGTPHMVYEVHRVGGKVTIIEP